MTTEKVCVELCRSQSVGSRYQEPQVLEYRVVSREEADELLRRRPADGTFWREQEDRTGN